MFVREILDSYPQVNSHRFSKEETLLIDINLSVRIYDEFIEVFSQEHKNYSKLTRNEFIKENDMVEGDLLRLLINDILSTEEYTLEGIAYAIQIPVDVVVEIASGVNLNPSLQVSAKVFRLHSQVRKDMYSQMIKKFFIESAA